ncbi:hypothetical protein CMO92_01420 [Candidatus Woesearchaeota archaeon]|nr:hypothetical protein [Candidatus Woesearchaeota archaeon]|tara:strand:+ start:1725 stop:2108 length:384 start_codon:yes stop_codon:yes gene_type:complete
MEISWKKKLVDIYLSWKKKLDSFREEYYLKIWVFNKHFKDSQVVVAIDDFKDFYDKTFMEAKTVEPFKFKDALKGVNLSINNYYDLMGCTEEELEYEEYKHIPLFKEDLFEGKKWFYFIRDVVWVIG